MARPRYDDDDDYSYDRDAEYRKRYDRQANGDYDDDRDAEYRKRYDRQDDDDDDYPRRRRYRRPAPYIQSYLVPSILVTCFCCLPFGVVAIVYASKVGSLVASGDYDEAQQASNSAKIWCCLSAGGHLLIFLALIAMSILTNL